MNSNLLLKKLSVLVLLLSASVALIAQPAFELEEVIPFKDETINNVKEFKACGDGFFFKTPVKDKWTETELNFYSTATKKSVLLSGLTINTNYQDWIVFNNNLIFAGNDGKSGLELWISDGTKKGTKLLKDCSVSPDKTGSVPTKFTELNSRIYFFITVKTFVNTKEIETQELWSTDGTTNGTMKVITVRTKSVYGKAPMIAFKNKLYFEGSDDAFGNQLWTSDGTATGTHMIKNKEMNANAGARPGDFMVTGDLLFFCADNAGYHKDLFVTNGTDDEAHWVKDIAPGEKNGLSMEEMVNYNDRLYFISSTGFSPDKKYEIWCSDGTEAGTNRVKCGTPFASSSTLDFKEPGNLVFNNGLLYFTEHDAASGNSLWSINKTAKDAQYLAWNGDCLATPEQEVLFKNFRFSNAISNGAFLTTQKDAAGGFIISKSDGTHCGTNIVKNIKLDVPKYDHQSADGMVALGNYFIYSLSSYTGEYPNTDNYYSELWATDGTEAGTFKLSPKRPDKESDGIYTNVSTSYSLVLNGSFYFIANFNGHNSMYKLTIK